MDAPWGRTLIEWHGSRTGRPPLVADCAYGVLATRRCDAAQGWDPLAPQPNRHANKEHSLDRIAFGGRNVVERFFCWTKRFRSVHVRYRKLDADYRGIIHFACAHIVTR